MKFHYNNGFEFGLQTERLEAKDQEASKSIKKYQEGIAAVFFISLTYQETK